MGAIAGVLWWLASGFCAEAASADCAPCHREIAARFARTGMARSFGRLDAGVSFSPGEYRHEVSGQRFTAFRRDGKAYLARRLDDGSFPLEREIHFSIGSGNHATGYVHRSASGALTELPLTWYAEGGWAMSPGYDRADHSGFRRKLNDRCLFCHTAYPAKGAAPQPIDCQRCHGSGEAHRAAARAGQPPERIRNSIVNPARLAPDRKMEVCLQCHLETTTQRLPSSMLRAGRDVFSYRPGEPLGDYILAFDHAPGTGHDDKFEFVSEAYRLRQSACFRKGQLTCTTCHDPHDIPRGREAVERYSKACLGCHASALASQVSSGRHTASRDCTPCHMPKRRPSDAAHLRVADHRISRRPAESTGVARDYRGEVSLYYPETLPDTPDNALALAAAQVRHQANLERGVPLLQALIGLHRPARGEYHFELGEAWRHLGRTDKAVEAHTEAARLSPSEWRHHYALGLALAATGRVEQALDAFRRAQGLAPAEPAIPLAMGETLSRQGRTGEAIARFRQALAIDPDAGEAHNNLATSLLKAGDRTGAMGALERAVELSPETPGIRTNLASLLARSGRFEEARRQFESLLRVYPSFAAGHSAYGTALAAAGQRDPAIARYERALALDSSLPVTHHNLAALLAGRGEPARAIEEYQAAIRLAPDYFEAHLQLGELLWSQGRKAEAEPHLEKAAASPDAALRQKAQRFLGML